MAGIQTFDFSVNLLKALLWQYNDAEALQSLLQSKQLWYDRNHRDFWQSWLVNVFDLATANDFGLSVWGILLGESRDVPVDAAGQPTDTIFGFGPYRRNFRPGGGFARNKDGYVRLSTDQYRLLLQLKYFKLVCRGTVPEINSYLQKLFAAQGKVYVLDPCDMSFAVYVFDFVPASWQMFLFNDMDALPRPAGVGSKILVLARRAFGFGPHNANYTGNFAKSREGAQ